MDYNIKPDRTHKRALTPYYSILNKSFSQSMRALTSSCLDIIKITIINNFAKHGL